MDTFSDGTWFDIVRVGTWNGDDYSWELLQEYIRNHNPNRRKVKLFIGHNDPWCFPEKEKPCLGFAQELRIDELGYLQGLAVDVKPELREGVNQGIYPDVSQESWYIPGQGWTLTGVAFLGATTPGCDSLRGFQFQAMKDRKLFVMPANMRELMAKPEHMERFSQDAYLFKQDYLIKGKEGEEEMDEAKIKQAAADAAKAVLKEFQEGDEFKALQAKAGQTDELSANVLQLEGENKTLKADKEQAASAAHVAEVKGYVEKLFASNKLTPAAIEEHDIEAILCSLDSTEVRQLGKQKEKKTQLKAVQDLVAHMLDASAIFRTVDEDGNQEPVVSQEDADIKNVNKALSYSLVDHAVRKQEEALAKK